MTAGVLLILKRGKIFARIDREVKGRFWRWYWGIPGNGFSFPLETRLLVFGLLLTAAGGANIYWSLTT